VGGADVNPAPRKERTLLMQKYTKEDYEEYRLKVDEQGREVGVSGCLLCGALNSITWGLKKKVWL